METLPILSCGTIHDESLNLLSFSQWISKCWAPVQDVDFSIGFDQCPTAYDRIRPQPDCKCRINVG